MRCRSPRKPWTRPLRRTRKALDSTIGRIEASARVIEAAERFAPSRPVAATRKFVLVAAWLAEATTRLGCAARGLDATMWSIALGGGVRTDAPQQLIDATARWTEATERLLEVQRHLDASFKQLHGALIDGVIFPEPFASALPVHQAVVSAPWLAARAAARRCSSSSLAPRRPSSPARGESAGDAPLLFSRSALSSPIANSR